MDVIDAFKRLVKFDYLPIVFVISPDHYEYDGKKPIRKGEKSAKVVLDLGDLIVERKFTEKGSYLAVTNKEGLKYPNPQKVLDALCGKLTFDPLEFARQKPEDQAKTLAALVGLTCALPLCYLKLHGDMLQLLDTHELTIIGLIEGNQGIVPNLIHDAEPGIGASNLRHVGFAGK